MELTISMAIMEVTVSVAIMQLEVSAALKQVPVFAANMWVTIFTLIMQMRVSLAIMQVVFSALDYAHDSFYCNYTGDSCNPFIWQPLFIKLNRKHLKALYQVCISPLL